MQLSYIYGQPVKFVTEVKAFMDQVKPHSIRRKILQRKALSRTWLLSKKKQYRENSVDLITTQAPPNITPKMAR